MQNWGVGGMGGGGGGPLSLTARIMDRFRNAICAVSVFSRVSFHGVLISVMNLFQMRV